MSFNTYRQREFLLLPLLITALTCFSVGALQIDLKNTCSGSSLYYCTLSNLTNSLEEPLVWITNSSDDQLKELLIYNSVMGRIPDLVFDIAPKLSTLIMHNCAVNNILHTNFQKALHLTKLVLQKNRLFIIPERVFEGLHLEELYLSHNTIHMIHRSAFKGLQSLKYLDLQANEISTLPQGIFDDLNNVEHLDLSYNEIEVIDAKTFSKTSKLTTLLLSENRFSVFEANALQHFNHLHLLDLSNTNLDELQLQSVDTLMVQGSKLKRCIISGSVIKLNAANNALKGLTVGDKLAVKELELHGNLLESLDDIVGMLNLQKLDVSKNQLISLKTSHSPMYLPLPNLISINLASNSLQNLTADNFMFLLKLKTLDLAFNHLIRLDSNIFQPLINLEKFYIEGNRLFEFNYIEFKESHTYLHEMGIFENDWEFRYLKRMLNYFRNHGIHPPMRFTPADSSHSTSPTYHETTDASIFKTNPSSTAHRDVNDVDILNDMNHARQFAHHDKHADSYEPCPLTGVAGIHPYWTTKDILALCTLIVVLLILLLLFFRILQEENCLPHWCTNCCSDLGSRERQPLRPRHRPLVEETSNV